MKPGGVGTVVVDAAHILKGRMLTGALDRKVQLLPSDLTLACLDCRGGTLGAVCLLLKSTSLHSSASQSLSIARSSSLCVAVVSLIMSSEA